MGTLTKDELKEILRLHGIWLNGNGDGKRADLRGANLSDADLRDAYLSDADLRGANLSDAYLRDADLRGANLSGANLSGANLSGANLRGANLRDADLRGANLSDANLSGANLRGANLRDADLRGANLRDADLRGANLRDAEGQNLWIKTLGSDIWNIVYTYDRLQIGCENHLITEWWGFGDERISGMDNQALEFWKRWKPILQAIISNNPAQPTGKEST